MHWTRPVVRVSTLLALVLLAACGSTTEPDPDDDPGATGSIDVTATTTGDDADTEYSASVGSSTQTLDANGSVTFTDVPVGDQTVTLTGVAANCDVTGGTSQTVTVAEGATATADFAVTCTAVPQGNADALIAEALDSLEQAMFAILNIDDINGLDDVSFAETKSLFEQALTLSPSNDTAAFGAAATTLFILEDDPDLRALAEDWDDWLHDDSTVPPGPGPAGLLSLGALAWEPATLPLDFSGASLEEIAYTGLAAARMARAPARTHETPPSITDVQTALGDIVRPALIEALDYMVEINDPAFTFIVTPGMQGEVPAEADPLELDITEIFATKAGIEAALASIGISLAYVVVPSPLSEQGLVDAMTPGSTFMTLASGGATLLSDALTRTLSAADYVLDGLDALEAETDDQSDDIIKYDDASVGEGLTPADVADARNVITDLQGALSTTTTVTINEGELDEYSFDLNAREFFVDPITDFKALLPDYDVFLAPEGSDQIAYMRWDALNLADWTFPDPTASGILPGMSDTQDLLDVFEELEELWEELNLLDFSYRLLTIDGVDCFDAYVTSGGGCDVGSDTYWDAQLLFDGYEGDGLQNAEFSAYGPFPNPGFNAMGTYTVTDAGDSDPQTFTVTMDLTNPTATIVVDMVDEPGYTSTDTHGRAVGGSVLTLDYLGSTWVFVD